VRLSFPCRKLQCFEPRLDWGYADRAKHRIVGWLVLGLDLCSQRVICWSDVSR
jgi:hypothetical protein